MRSSVIFLRACALLAGLLITCGAIAFVLPPVPDTLFYQRYPFIRFVQDNDSLHVTDDDILDQAAKVVFPVNKYNLPLSDSVLKELADIVIPQMNRDSLQLRQILLRGAASPEGPWLNNQMLGERRAQALLDFLKSHSDFPMSDDVLSKQIVTEDYRLLVLLMKRASDPDYQLVSSLCDTYLPDGRYQLLKTKLQQAKGRRLWPRLLKTYFPQLRAARLILQVKKFAPPKEQPRVFAETPMENTAVVMVKPAEKVIKKPVEPEPVEMETLVVPRRELLALKTNLLFYGVYMPRYDRWCPIPNVAVEYYPLRGHFTYGASLDFPWWIHYDQHKFFEVRNYQLESRYYFKGAKADEADGTYRAPAYRGFYLQGYVHGGLFEIAFDANNGWKGEGVGAGLGLGYVMPISRNGHWRLEFNLQAGWFGCRYDPFQHENPVNPNYRDNLYYYKWTLSPSLFKRRQYRFNWVGPTRVGITLSYDLLYRRRAKKGVSFKATEIMEVIRAHEAHEANETYESYEGHEPNEPERRTEP